MLIIKNIIFINNYLFLEKATDSVQYFLRNNTQYNYESELNDLGRESPLALMWLLLCHHYVIVHYIVVYRESDAEALV